MALAGIRRAAFTAQFAAAAVLPLWLMLGYALWGGSVLGLLGVLLVAPAVLVVELGLALLLSARSEVRRTRMLDAPALGVLGAWWLGVVGFGFFGPATAWFGLLAVAAAIAGFWLGGRLLVEDVRRTVRTTMAGFGAPQQTVRPPLDAGEYVVIKPASR